MTGPELRTAREKLSLTGGQLAAILGYGAAPRIYEMEARPVVPGPVALAMRAMAVFGLPDTWPS